MSDSASRPRRKRAPRFDDIAAAAGVSPATVNRVLNDRGGVSPERRARVIAAARELGVPRVLPDPHHGLIRFDVVLAASATPYFDRLEQAFERAAQALAPRVLLHRHRCPTDDETRLARLLGQPPHRRNGLIVALPDSPTVRAALREQVAAAVPVVTLMSGVADVPGLHYAGIDNLQAGRTAGHFIGRMAGPASGQVLLVTHQLSFRAHAERIRGCTEVLAERFAHLRVRGPVACTDDPDRVHFAVREALAACRAEGLPLRGLYTSGAGTAGVPGALLREAPAVRPVWVGHEIHAAHRALLRTGTLELVIDQAPEAQVQGALTHLQQALGLLDHPVSSGPINFALHCLENLGGEHA
ncbi:LacI family DNA-binding transcriptional regulator [Ideonella livida]|uniref:LacI family transcriptional regulator n=1 Tax=Ideonella livida TaxID=2707176 RepID=A0A7C9PHG2_9BURK|nr:LacI family DNA-binding transcriptional regulator [Ideonella livida]NDY92073.1 LacI family transcriptional regulator [Ideonella livida]